MKLPESGESYDNITAIAITGVENMYLRTKTFGKHTQLKEVIKWARSIYCSGKLIITIDEDTIRPATEDEQKDENLLSF